MDFNFPGRARNGWCQATDWANILSRNDMKEKTPYKDFWLFTETEKSRKRLTNQEPLSKSSEVCRKLLLKCSQWGLNPHGGLNKSVLQLEHNGGARWNQNTRPKQHYGKDLSRERTFLQGEDPLIFKRELKPHSFQETPHSWNISLSSTENLSRGPQNFLSLWPFFPQFYDQFAKPFSQQSYQTSVFHSINLRPLACHSEPGIS